MVYICPAKYPEKKEEYKPHFNKYSYELHDFQKYAIEAIVEGNHTLITAPTGSGKTMPGEFAVEYFVAQGKKVIYTTPLKALSNQKYYDFTRKFPDISIGILTGDIKSNPDADVLIMTTEVLLNKLYSNNSRSQIANTSISFEMDINTELAAVIFDECHYVNDKHRGHVWENSIIMLPYQVQMILLSATIDKPEKFALWVENCKKIPEDQEKKIVYLSTRDKRPVPLTHYSYINTPSAIFKIIKDKTLEKEIRDVIAKPNIIQSHDGKFDETYYHKMRKTIKLFKDRNVVVKRQFIMNEIAKYLFDNQMLPALCFLFSRKQIEIAAKEMTAVILEDDSKIPYIIRKECEQIIRKLTNYEEYLHLPEYNQMVDLLEKGVAIHHSGVLPPLREMVELLFSKGYIKILFSTETLSVGINMPVKTVIFTDINKFDGENPRTLYSHEYTQIAGRAGRLGIDKVGNVIHLNNIFRSYEMNEYRNMMKGTPQTLVSKFKISFNLILNLIDIGDNNFVEFAKRSMIQNDIVKEMGVIKNEMVKIEGELQKLEAEINQTRTPRNILEEYFLLKTRKRNANNKKRKDIEKSMKQIEEDYPFLETDKQKMEHYYETQKEHEKMQNDYFHTETYLDNNVAVMLDFLENESFVMKDTESGEYKLTDKGCISTQLKEVHCLVFGDLIHQKTTDALDATQLIGLFSCFTNVSVPEDRRTMVPRANDHKIQSVVLEASELYQKYYSKEDTLKMNTGIEYELQYDLVHYITEWCKCENSEQCKLVLQNLELEKGVFLGEFVKAVLKINNIANEMEKIAEMTGNIPFLSKLNEIKYLTLKYIVTNQSLYV